MTEKLKFFSVIIFATDDHRFSGQDIHGKSRQMEILLPIDAISHLTEREAGNPSSYKIHLKKNYPLDAPFPIKSYNPGFITAEQVEILKLN
jgi:hypothetical protein